MKKPPLMRQAAVGDVVDAGDDAVVPRPTTWKVCVGRTDRNAATLSRVLKSSMSSLIGASVRSSP
jgi:hypothetical protein